eukprot:6209295-Prymnesium_polylepis.1
MTSASSCGAEPPGAAAASPGRRRRTRRSNAGRSTRSPNSGVDSGSSGRRWQLRCLKRSSVAAEAIADSPPRVRIARSVLST